MENVKKRNKESNNDNVLKQEDIQFESIRMLDILLVFFLCVICDFYYVEWYFLYLFRK